MDTSSDFTPIVAGNAPLSVLSVPGYTPLSVLSVPGNTPLSVLSVPGNTPLSVLSVPGNRWGLADYLLTVSTKVSSQEGTYKRCS